MKFLDLGRRKYERIQARYPDATETVVNTEMTIAGACGPLEPYTTKWDKSLDRACARPGFQPLEYMTGGRYVGELIRTIFLDYMTEHHDPVVSASQLPATIVHGYSFSTTFVSNVVSRARSDGELAGELKRRIPPPESSNWAWTPQSAGALRKIAYHVQTRSAGLIAASLVGLLATVGEIQLVDPSMAGRRGTPPVDRTDEAGEIPAAAKVLSVRLPTRTSRDGFSAGPDASWHAGPEELVIAYAGGIIQHYPNFKEQCQRFVDRLVMRAGPQAGGKSVFLREACDGGIIGAGVLAGMESLRLSRANTDA